MNSGGIKRNEKFAFVAMSAHVEDTVSEIVFGAGIRATTKLPLTLDEEWKTWIGSIRTNYLEEDCTLFLYASLISKTAGILDRENVQLAGRVSRQLEALTLTGNIIMAKAPILATGAHDSYGASLRQISDIVVPFVPGGVNYHYIDERMLREAYALMNARLAFEGLSRYDRMQRIFYIFTYALREQNPHERLHQFCRCIEGFILPDPGRTQSQFTSRTELFIGPRHHATTKQLYDMRSRVEHMHEYEYPAGMAERDRRLLVMRMSALAESLARYCVRNFLLNRSLWPHYATADALAAFWKLSRSEREAIWGPPADLTVLGRDFDPTLLTDEMLGLIKR